MSRALDVEGSDAIPSRLVGLFRSVSQSVRNASVTLKRTQLSQCAALASPWPVNAQSWHCTGRSAPDHRHALLML
jgi:hypothetical protein